jgi:hypothetical protein
MRRRKGLTLIDTIILILVLIFAIVILWPRLKIYRIASRVVCGTSVKGLASALDVYANDYEGRYPQLPGTGPWSKQLGFAYDLVKPDFKEGGAQRNVGRSISASLYLLVRYSDVSPNSFVCNVDREANRIIPFDGKNPANRGMTELWDFGPEPYEHVSYAMHNPYGAYPVTNSRSMKFAILADMNPWFKQGDIAPPTISRWRPQKNITLLPPYFSNPSIPLEKIRQSNAMAHERWGQCVAFADGHSEFVKTPDVGINHDNIYTYWSTPTNPTESDIRIGANPTSRSKENDAQSPDDSFLAI